MEPDQPTTWPVSCKGVVLAAAQVLLAANDRGEWELPGGRLEMDETPQDCVAREVAEETGLDVVVDGIIDSWIYEPVPGRKVLIVTYGCGELGSVPDLTVSPEHREIRFLPLAELDGLHLPDGYRRSILTWAARRADGGERPGPS